MPTALLDTNAVSDLMRDHPHLKARIGKHTAPRAQKILVALRIEPVTELIANVYGGLKASLESQGLNLDDNDLWIAATAITQGSLLVTRDHIFTHVPGLQVEDWSV
jgi:predicted nucleic acid-binding protein